MSAEGRVENQKLNQTAALLSFGWVFGFQLDSLEKHLITPVFFFSRDIFFGARDIFGKNARDIKKMPVTILGKNASDIPDFKISKIPH